MGPSTSQTGGQATVHLKISVPELTDINPFFIRDYPTHRTFAELFQECVNHPNVRRSQHSLVNVRATRHFWQGDQMALNTDSIASTLQHGAAASNEISLVLRRDFYRIGPAAYVVGGEEYLYLNAEMPVQRVIEETLNKDERPCCFDLCDSHRRRLSPERTLASYGLLPAWQESGEAFPERAILYLQPQKSIVPSLVLALVLFCGIGGGFLLGRMFVH